MSDLDDETLDESPEDEQNTDDKDYFDEWLRERESANDEPIDEEAHRDAELEESDALDEDETVEVGGEQLVSGTDYTEVDQKEFDALLRARTADAQQPTEADLRAEFEAEKARKEQEALAREFTQFMQEQAEASRDAVWRLTPAEEPQEPQERVYGDLSGMSDAEIHALAKERLLAGMSYAELANRGIDLADAPSLRDSEVIEEPQYVQDKYSEEMMSSSEFAKVVRQRDAERNGEGSPF